VVLQARDRHAYEMGQMAIREVAMTAFRRAWDYWL
jgi:hypothetical protein